MIAVSSRGSFYLALAATLAFRLWLSAVAPITADEAYFVLWGRNPDIGFYDHPPMIGWLLAPLTALSDADWVARLPVTLLPAAVGLAVREALRRWFGKDEDTANLAGLAVLLVPLNVWGVLVTTDAPLVLFSVISLLLFARAAQIGSLALFAASGAALGLAFLSKYFAVLLGLGYLAWAAASAGAPRRWSGPLAAVAAAVPFGLLNLWWNYEACWSNVMFNAINRHESAGWSVLTPVLYLASLAYLAAPILWTAWRARDRIRAAWREHHERALLLAWLVPLAVFALLSPVRRIGLHWLLSFVPALILTAALAMERRHLEAIVRFFAVFAGIHIVAIVVIAALPVEIWKSTPVYGRLVFPGRIGELLTATEPMLKTRILAADSYASAALFAYHARRPVPVFGTGTSHARQDDIATDWRSYAGKDLLILRREAPAAEEYGPFFREIEVRALPLGGGMVYAVLGRDFQYERYRAIVLNAVRDRYYRIPKWLPVGGCYFFERYFPR
ncbi:MAG: glycosyltransferase family 39 protein [Betaproteobacteria bacterium]|nr:glycosyltransferase family 39 protein [Betaproteobacteria bacterium]